MEKLFCLLMALPFASFAQNELVTLNSGHTARYTTIETLNSTSSENGSCASFNAVPNEGKVFLYWSESSTANTNSYMIEKSNDGLNFETVSTLRASETTNEIINYSETDFQPFSGTSFYRIKLIDQRGNSSYSSTITVKNLTGSVGTIDVKENHSASMQGSKTKNTLVVILDNSGKEYYSKAKIKSKGDHLYASHLSTHLQRGTYLVIASSNTTLYSQKLTIK